MSTTASARAREMFDAAMEMHKSERRAFVERECAEDEGLRTDVLSLLEALDRRGDALDAGAASALGMGAIDDGSHAADAGRIEQASVPEIVGVSIGGYRLVRMIGAGGMGTVYEAVQESPRRTVAVQGLLAHVGARRAVDAHRAVRGGGPDPGSAPPPGGGAGIWGRDARPHRGHARGGRDRFDARRRAGCGVDRDGVRGGGEMDHPLRDRTRSHHA